MYPTSKQIIDLHKKYASDTATFELIYTHSQIVAEIAAQLLRNKPQEGVDEEFVRAACMLHDIGAYTLFENGSHTKENYILHGLKGQEILDVEGYDPKISRVASHHTGVGIKKEDIIKDRLPLPLHDYVAESKEEELIMYADKFHSKTPKFNSYESYIKFVSEYGSDKVREFERLAAKFGKPNLEEISQKYNHPLI